MSKSKKKADKQSKGSEKSKEQSFRAEGKTIATGEIVKVLKELGGVNLTSTAIRDKLGFKERDTVRRMMGRLVEDGVVKVEHKSVKEGEKQLRFYYSLTEGRNEKGD
jgi:transcription initiation factor IIE alpha subunit